jgi:parallel beta-helix repeat protein
MRRHLGLMLLAALAVVTLLALNGAPALANHVQCGDVISQDTKLDSDLIDCPGDGVVIGANGITLDLAGHLVDGIRTPHSAGVRNTSFADITVRNGTVSQFRDGVTLEYLSSRNVVRDLTVTDAVSGIYVDAAGSLVGRNHVSGAGVGIDVYGADSRVIRNELDGNGTGIRSHAVSEWVSDISQNVIVNSGGAGILLVDTDKNRLSGNLIVNNGVAQAFPFGEGISMAHTYNTVVEKNVVAGNGIGIKMNSYSHGNRFHKNHISSNNGDGIWVFEGTYDNVIEHNMASHNGDDGIDIDDTEGDTLMRNRAHDNGDLGIEAAVGVIDGGGNRAVGNGNPLQCLIVTCK